jgi:hypothetical protein
MVQTVTVRTTPPNNGVTYAAEKVMEQGPGETE